MVYYVTWTGDVRETPEGVLTAHHFWKGKSFFSQEEAEQFIRKDITGQFGESAESLME